MDVQNILETSEPRPKQKNRRPEPPKHTKDHNFGYLGIFILYIFSTLRDVFPQIFVF